MTSFKPAYISPFPIECPNCDTKIRQNDVFDVTHIYKRKRILEVKCVECGVKYKIKQKPLFSDFTIEEIDK